MATSPHYRGNNQGGFGNPPVKNQFDGTKPGPGRPKGSKSIDGALRKTFRKKVASVDKRTGRRVYIDAPNALAERALQLGLQGGLAANIEARKLAEKYGPADEVINYDLSCLSDLELQMYGYIAYRLRGNLDDPDLTPKFERILLRFAAVLDEEESAEVIQGHM